MAQNDCNIPQPRPAHQCAGSGSASIVLGLVFVFVGVVVLLDRANVGRHLPEQLWPFVFIAAGAVRFVTAAADGSPLRSRRPGIGWLIIGCWGAVNEFHLFGFDYDTSWPLLLVAAGAMMVWRAVDAPVAAHAGRPE